MKIVWTENSEIDLDDLYEYIAKDSPIYAERFVDRILSEVADLAIAPRMGKMVPEANSDVIRERIVQSQRVIYLINDEHQIISILALVHVRRDLINDPEKPWGES